MQPAVGEEDPTNDEQLVQMKEKMLEQEKYTGYFDNKSAVFCANFFIFLASILHFLIVLAPLIVPNNLSFPRIRAVCFLNVLCISIFVVFTPVPLFFFYASSSDKFHKQIYYYRFWKTLMFLIILQLILDIICGIWTIVEMNSISSSSLECFAVLFLTATCLMLLTAWIWVGLGAFAIFIILDTFWQIFKQIRQCCTQMYGVQEIFEEGS